MAFKPKVINQRDKNYPDFSFYNYEILLTGASGFWEKFNTTTFKKKI